MKTSFKVSMILGSISLVMSWSLPTKASGELNSLTKSMSEKLSACAQNPDAKAQSQCQMDIMNWLLVNPDIGKLREKYPNFVVSARHGLFGTEDFCKIGTSLSSGLDGDGSACTAQLRGIQIRYLIEVFNRTDDKPLPLVPSDYMSGTSKQ